MINSPGFNPSTNSGRGDWSLRDVSYGNVKLDRWWYKPECIDHGAMNLVNVEGTIWRCLNCGRACYDMDQHNINLGHEVSSPSSYRVYRGGIKYPTVDTTK